MSRTSKRPCRLRSLMMARDGLCLRITCTLSNPKSLIPASTTVRDPVCV